MPSANLGRPVVFLGPTLPMREAEHFLQATYLPPASQGSVVRAVKQFDPSAILLVDGVFERYPAVRHKELLWAIGRGIPVFGAASMGALRAAELATSGMLGVGVIYRWYRRFPLLPDDAVAVLHGPSELGSPPLTRALVDMKITLRRAKREGAVDAQTHDLLARTAATVNFRERTFTHVIRRALPGLDDTRRRDLRLVMIEHFVSQKRQDTISALKTLAAESSTLRQVKCRPQFIVTNAFVRDMREAGIDFQ